jgi:endonuclease YncB( thermonuclease family)
MVAGGMAAHLATGGKLPSFLQPVSTTLSTVTGDFALCSVSFGRDCVIDGDTIEVNGERIRMLDFDTPEISEPKCASEYAKGQEAKFRLLELLNSGTVEIRTSGARDSDKYGRKLRLVLVNGRSVGDVLIAEGLAWPWEGRRHAWCG